MTQVTLRSHPDTATPPLYGIVVEVSRSASGLRLCYLATGDIDALRVPAPGAPARVDELWKHTCFEAFLRLPGTDGYLEFNFAPSSQWAAYAFAGYRERVGDPDVATPAVTATANTQALMLAADLDLAAVGLDPAAPWRLGLSAVIEDKGGERSYWALAHPPGKPDFHHTSGFTLYLPPPDRP